MELLKENEITSIAKQCGFTSFKVLSWEIEQFSGTMIGYLGDHLKLIIVIESEGIQSKLHLFVKCMPRCDKIKANYLREMGVFEKEYMMLSKLFKGFINEGSLKWRPKTYLVNEELFVFEDVTKLGYRMPDHQKYILPHELEAAIDTLARFHAQSLIYEEKITKQLGKQYRIWDDFSDYLQEPIGALDWRNTGRDAVIDFLKVHSSYKARPNFPQDLDNIIPKLFVGAMGLMSPSPKYRNVVAHRDLWANNILLKEENVANEKHAKCHAVIVDFQTVLYCSPMVDLCSLIYFNTSRKCRNESTYEFINFYFNALSRELLLEGINVDDILNRTTIFQAYEESILFGITQAALIVPLSAMTTKKQNQIFSDPETSLKANVVSRSEHFLQLAEEDEYYRNRVVEIFDEIVERYCINVDGTNIK